LISEDRALHQDIRPLQLAILNLMPDKIRTETQLLRAIGATPLQIEITLLNAGTHESKNTSQEHLIAFYQTHADVKNRKFDGLIVTGAPIEHLPYEQVNYWDELKDIMEWAKTNVYSSFFICWGAQAALFHYHGVPKHALPGKQSGVYPHRVVKPYQPLITGFDDIFNVPVSRNTEIRSADVAKIKNLEILVESEKTGVCLVQDPAHRRVYMFNHLEYDPETLKREYDRDVAAGVNPSIPYNYFPDNDPGAVPRINWRAHRHLLFSNWINMVYQGTPYDLNLLESVD
jgi:homoserine O-succinyltransferase/O-acetyltransferase